jgi:lipid-binding SYLF domain-containing protein
MIRFSLKTSVGIVAASLVLAIGAAAHGSETDGELIASANRALAVFEKTDPSLTAFLQRAPGFVVFPKIGKAGLGVGGAHGDGVVYEQGKPVGKAEVTQVSIGAQAGAQKYGELIVFETQANLEKFKQGKFAFSGQVSAVAVKSGASANARFTNGVAVFTEGEGGLMLEASVGGQKFSYHPFGPH